MNIEDCYEGLRVQLVMKEGYNGVVIGLNKASGYIHIDFDEHGWGQAPARLIMPENPDDRTGIEAWLPERKHPRPRKVKPTFNLIQACTDTLVSRLSQDRPQPILLTIDGKIYRIDRGGTLEKLLTAYAGQSSSVPKPTELPTQEDPKKSLEETQRTCWHQWEKYTGFKESYEYCKKCDLRKK